jgi:transposase
VYLPPYSPDYNPIEQAFAKVKARLRAAEIRTVAGVEDFLGQVLDEFPPGECASYLRHCGYTATDFPKAL